MRGDELKTRIIYDQNNEPVEVAIPYSEYKAIEHLLEETALAEVLPPAGLSIFPNLS
jgi:hypothetical protein